MSKFKTELIIFLEKNCKLMNVESQRISKFLLSNFSHLDSVDDLLAILNVKRRPHLLEAVDVDEEKANHIRNEAKKSVYSMLKDLDASSVANLIKNSIHKQFQLKEEIDGRTLATATDISILKRFCVVRCHSFVPEAFMSFVDTIKEWALRIHKSLIEFDVNDSHLVSESMSGLHLDTNNKTLRNKRSSASLDDTVIASSVTSTAADSNKRRRTSSTQQQSDGHSDGHSGGLLLKGISTAQAPTFANTTSTSSITKTESADERSLTTSTYSGTVVTLRYLKKTGAALPQSNTTAKNKDRDTRSTYSAQSKGSTRSARTVCSTGSMRSARSTKSSRSTRSTRTTASAGSQSSKSGKKGTKRTVTPEVAIRLACANLSYTITTAWTPSNSEDMRKAAVIAMSKDVCSQLDVTGRISECLVETDIMDMAKDILLDPTISEEFKHEVVRLLYNVAGSDMSLKHRYRLVESGVIDTLCQVFQSKLHPSLRPELLRAIKNLCCGPPVVSVERLTTVLPMWVEALGACGREVVEIVCRTLNQLTTNALEDSRPNIFGPIVTAFINVGFVPHLIRLSESSRPTIVLNSVCSLSALVNNCKPTELMKLVRTHSEPLMAMLAKRLTEPTNCFVAVSGILAAIAGCNIVGQMHVSFLLEGDIFSLLVARFNDKSCAEGRDNIYSTCVYAVGMAGEQQVVNLAACGVFRVLCHPDKSSDVCALIPAMYDAIKVCMECTESMNSLWNAIEDENGWQMLNDLRKSKNQDVCCAAHDPDWVALLKKCSA